MKRMYKSLIAIIALIFFIAISTLFLNKVINPVNKNNYKAESKKEIVFEPYFLDENKIKILVIAQDDENLLSTLEQINREGKVLNKINCNNKNKVTLDIEINGDETYEFIATNTLGEKISKNLEVNDEFRKNIIKTNISIDESTIDSNGLALKENVEIDYGNNSNLNMKTEYKIGNGEWKEYNKIIDIDCNEIVSNKEQEDDNKTIIIYARKIDDIGNQILTISKTVQFDVDAPQMPEITIEQKAKYPTITDEGVCLDNTVTIKFDDEKENLLNQYSIDGGETWHNCDTGIYTFNTLKGIVYAKSTKETGLTITKKVNVSMANVTASSALASDALTYKAYDGDTTTYVGAYHVSFWESDGVEIPSIGGYMLVDETAINKNLNVYFSRTGSESPGASSAKGDIRIYCYDDNEKVLSTTIINKAQSGIGKKAIQIPENTKKIYFYMIITDTGWSGGNGYARIHNIEIENQ